MPAPSELIVLPFDHRGSFLEEMFGVYGLPTEEEIKRVQYFKQMIYGGFRLAVADGKVPIQSATILVDEQFGDGVLRDAKQNGYGVCVCAEKSGQDEFELEYGKDFEEHIRKYQPDYVKALVRYNPEEDSDLNERQCEKLKVLSDFCFAENYKLMIEPLVLPTEKQLDLVGGDRDAYDQEMRPRLMELMMEELQENGVEPDIWKIEGLEEACDYEMLVEQARANGRRAGIIVLGRHAPREQVEKWLRAARGIEGVMGFAIGRTIFWDPLCAYKEGKIKAEEAMRRIAEDFAHYYQVYAGRG